MKLRSAWTTSFPRTEVGRAVHRVLALGSGALAPLPSSLRAEAERLAQRFWQSAYGQRTMAAGDVRRELPVMAAGVVSQEPRPQEPRPQKPGPQEPGGFLRGTLDLLTFANGRPDLLLDYKTNDISADQVQIEAAHYRVQMLLYALLVEAAFGDLPREAVLFFLAPGVAHRVETDALKRSRKRAGWWGELFAAQRRGPFPRRR